MSWLSQKSKGPADYVLSSKLRKFPLLVWLWLLLMKVLSSLGIGILVSDGVTKVITGSAALNSIYNNQEPINLLFFGCQ